MPIARIRMPRMGTSVHESTVVTWKKAVGESVAKGEPLLSAESDKVEFEIESPADGTLKEILVAADATVPVGEVLALVETEAEVPDEAGEAPAPPASGAEWVAPVAPLPPRKRPELPLPPTRPPSTGAPKPFLSPRVQRLAAERGLGLDVLARIPGTGAGGRVTARDVENFLAGGEAAPPAVTLSFRPLAADAPGGERERHEPFSRVRRRIAENLTRSVRDIPQVAVWAEADAGRLVAWREANKEAFRERHGAGLTYTPLFALALLAALREPGCDRFNGACDGESLTVKNYLNLGLAVDAPDGLIVPVVHGADGLGFAELALRIDDLAGRARSGRLTPDEVRGGTLTLTNFGASGVLNGAPLLNPPEVAIVGTGAIVPRPVALPGGGVGIRPMMGIALTFDHRANDGMAAGRFIAAIRAALEGMDLSQLEY